MTAIRSLRVYVGVTEVGSLFAMDDGRTYFRFDDAYAHDKNRPLLSLSFQGNTEAETVAQLLDPGLPSTHGAGAGRLPVFFRNLLPEGMLRKHLLQEGGIVDSDELGLLAYCGEDLPGDVRALGESLDDRQLGRLVTQGRDSYEMSSHQLPTPGAVSLSGVQPKVSLVAASGGRYVMRSKNDTGLHFIGKLPASDFERLPEVEYLSMQLAAAAGVEVCTVELLPLTAIASQLPFGLREDARNFLLVHRFDRDADTPTSRVHMEDFAQVLEQAPEEKYLKTYAEIGLVLREFSDDPHTDMVELVRRVKVNELLGNYDAHLKNFSMLYRSGSRRLSPAYDVVAYSAYLQGRGHALLFYPEQRSRSKLTPRIVRELANIWQIPETQLSSALAATVDAALRRWPALIADSALTEVQKTRLLAHLEANPSVMAWRKRNVKKVADEAVSVPFSMSPNRSIDA